MHYFPISPVGLIVFHIGNGVVTKLYRCLVILCPLITFFQILTVDILSYVIYPCFENSHAVICS